ncbi:DUF4190 domain-containing protein, partial [Corynebacterium bovis]|uniref:DUF4190 domain-containing protein n=1 Tax=Corynebacterium bovis TaxID=36808 RepID=UPI0036CADA0E
MTNDPRDERRPASPDVAPTQIFPPGYRTDRGAGYPGGASGAGSAGSPGGAPAGRPGDWGPAVAGAPTPGASQGVTPVPVGTSPAGVPAVAPVVGPSQNHGPLAVAALTLGVLAIVVSPVGIILGLAAVILGALAVSSARTRLRPTGLAVAGIVTGVIGFIMSAVLIGGFMYIISELSDGCSTLVGSRSSRCLTSTVSDLLDSTPPSAVPWTGTVPDPAGGVPDPGPGRAPGTAPGDVTDEDLEKLGKELDDLLRQMTEAPLPGAEAPGVPGGTRPPYFLRLLSKD